MHDTSKEKKKIEKKDRGTIKQTLIRRKLKCLYISQDVLPNKENCQKQLKTFYSHKWPIPKDNIAILNVSAASKRPTEAVVMLLIGQEATAKLSQLRLEKWFNGRTLVSHVESPRRPQYYKTKTNLKNGSYINMKNKQ